MTGEGAAPEDDRRYGRYVVEVAHDGGYVDIRRLSAGARKAAAARRASGEWVRFLRTVYVPEDGACLLIFEAPRASAARAAAGAAGLRVTKVSRTLAVGRGRGTDAE